MTPTDTNKPWTAGEWTREGDFFEHVRVEFEGSGHYITVASPDRDYPIAFVIGTPGHCWNDDAEQEANANLLLAAPDMAEALAATRALVAEAAMVGFNHEDGDWCERLFKNQGVITAALQKARGGES
ncbi:hypothetical protein IWC96_14645 [Brevundimonas sp. BAL450]|uniref:hypothetical protein n=1 Tax=Brevundimonas sp. BAL450 TaxID=1708162 RepID=UPI0018CA6DC3|nr:hypothetical protein [Brevundimonas sp. BAL450]MBG7616514.1 hypothetical protein [Brevundimonas sp. BAL450]